MKLVLASGSPRRSMLLSRMGVPFEVIEPRVEEISSGMPGEIVVENARRKARSVHLEDGVVISADTVVECRGKIMGKPANVNDAREMLLLQIGEEQNICTGICVIDVTGGKVVSGFEVSRVGMKGGSKEVEDYLESGLWKGKAGSFGIRDEGGMEVELIVGEEDNVMGFPGRLALRLLDLVGFDYPDETPSGGG